MPHWAAIWTASAQGPYPTGNPSAQPDQRFAFPVPEIGARDQTFRLIVKPSLWCPTIRLRFSNDLGARPVTFDGVFVALRRSGAVVVPGTSRPATFAGAASIAVRPGTSVWSDPVALPFVSAPAAPHLPGSALAVSFHIAGESGPMTWHAKALTTSYVSPPGGGAKGDSDGVLDFPYTTASWFFLNAIETMAPDDTRVVACFGDSITDGTCATMNGDDRWPDVLLQRLHAAGATRIAVVNAGIGGNQVVGPKAYSPANPMPGGPSALERLERDLLSLSGLTSVIWLEGINDLGRNGGATPEAVFEGMRHGVARMRARFPGIEILGATVTSALGSTSPAHGDKDQDAARRRLNDFILNGGVFDAVADFDAATVEPATGGIRAEFAPDSTIGGPGDWLHPNRAGYAAMAASIPLDRLLSGP